MARLAVDETGYGVYEHKIHKNRYNTGFVARWMLQRRAVGVLWVDDEARVTAVGCPMGVIAGIIPVTNPTSTALFKCLAAVKSGNAVVLAPHPRAARCTLRAAEIMAAAATRAGAPEGLISCLENPTLPATRELMSRREIALVLATGGPGMVRAAYSSGKPTIAVGAGNVPAYVGASVPDPAEAAEMIITSKSFDNGTACVAEQSVVVADAVAPAFLAEFEARGAYWMNAPQQAALVRVLFDDRGALRPDAVGQTALRLAELAGFAVPSTTRVLACELDRVGADTRSRGRSSARCCRSTGCPTPRPGCAGAARSSPSTARATPPRCTRRRPRRSRRSGRCPRGGSSSTPRRCSAAWASRRRSTPPSSWAPGRGAGRSARTTSRRCT
ncbi:aldehyde dehydrogenase family protein [Pseudonocardia benzenivorans]